MIRTVFIDGAAGTTGLEIAERLAGRNEFSLVALPDAERKDAARRAEALNGADFVILCLPDAAAIEAVAMVSNPAVRIIDASTAHRVAPGWAYGFPELDAAQREAIRERNVLKLLAAGGNAYYLAKFACIFGLDMQDIGAQQTGVTKEAFQQRLLAAARA